MCVPRPGGAGPGCGTCTARSGRPGVENGSCIFNPQRPKRGGGGLFFFFFS